MDRLLTASGLFAGYEGFDVLRGVDFEVSPGETIAIIGPNGAGKSTLLRALFGMVSVRQGRVEFAGENITSLAPALRLRRGISYVPQGRVNFPAMSVEENLDVAGHLLEHKQVRVKTSEMLDRFPVLGLRRRQLAGTMSGGEQQQLEIAMALMFAPRLMLIDEPSLGLDPRNVELVFGAIATLHQQGVTMVLVEQNAFRALRSSDRAYVLEQGEVRLSAPAESILQNDEVKRLYLGGAAHPVT